MEERRQAGADDGRADTGGAAGARDIERRRFEVLPEHHGRRLDQVLVEAVPGWSRSRLQALVKAGQVTVDGAVVQRPNHLVEPKRGVGGAASVIEIALPVGRPPALDVSGAPIDALPVLFADDDVVVIDKPAGLVSHPRLGVTSESALGALSVSDLAEARFGALPVGQGMGRPGIVHRLDRLTSGVMVLARSEHAMQDLMRQFRHRTVEKTYLALVHGAPRFDSQWIDAPLAQRPDSPDRQRVATQAQLDSGEAREAETFVEVRERFAGFTLLACHPKTGRTHQIRVHLQHASLPLVGDRIYHARGALATPLPAAAPPLERQALHASTLAFDHPRTGERLRFEAALPPDLAALLGFLREHAPPA